MGEMMSTTTNEFMCAGEGRRDPVKQDQIKSRDRVRDLAEVFTHEREVEAMLDFVPEMFEAIDSTFLEPACGNGNFLVEILRRKLSLIDEERHGGTKNWFEVAVLRTVMSIYAVDICHENVAEAQARLSQIVASEFEQRKLSPSVGFEVALAAVLDVNVVCADSLQGAGDITFFEWTLIGDERFARTPFPLEAPNYDLFHMPPEPIAPVHYTELGDAQ